MQPTQQDLLGDISKPDDGVVETLSNLQGDLLLLGAGGKIGHGLALMAKRAMKNRVIAVSRFGDPATRKLFDDDGIETIQCDLTDTAAVQNLPDASDVIYLVGQKFGTSEGNESMTWVMNAYVPGIVAQRWQDSRIALYSSGNVYAFTSVDSDGPAEDGLLGPIGEYAQSVVGRERVFEYYARQNGTKMTTLRLNYATEPRYGVLVDIATQVLAGETVDVTQGYANVVWAGDVNRVTLRSLDIAASPPTILNLAGPKIAVRDVVHQFADLFGVEPKVAGTESDKSLLSNGDFCWKTFGPPHVDVDEMIQRIAAWLKADMATWRKPTHFEVRDGKF
jgi:nucleoside-diphosphate-sugar epimerase